MTPDAPHPSGDAGARPDGGVPLIALVLSGALRLGAGVPQAGCEAARSASP